MPDLSARSLLIIAGAMLEFCTSTARAQPATPREELLALVPSDVGLCLLIGDLRGHAGCRFHER